MYLKRIELQGFKSFADKTEIHFGKDITSIIGPNGSGKSNITDAVRWVLGEQSMKTLRGSKLNDIIFNGTSQRKSMGFAEVDLILDNSKKLIDIDYNEIKITRKVFRNGNSEYYINMSPCRLKDIQDLFYDTGIGRTGYSIISQGKIDEILSNKSEDRRQIFEEASGIMKYKLRKLESERKLEKTEQNLLRIKDIISELEIQLDPLKEQAEIAKKYLNLRDQLKQIRIDLFVHNVDKLDKRKEKVEKELEEIEDQKNKNREEKAQIINDEEIKLSTIEEFEDEIEKAKEELYNKKNELDRLKSEISIVNEKISNTEENKNRYKDEIKEYKKEISELDVNSTKKTKKIEYLEEQLKKYENELNGYEKEYNLLIESLDNDERIIDEMKDEVMDKLDSLSAKKSQEYNVNSYIDNLLERNKELEKDIRELITDKDNLRIEKNEINNKLNEKDSKINEYLSKLEKANKKNDELNANREKIYNDLNKINSDNNILMSRVKVLKEMEKNYEGYSRSVKEILKLKDKNVNFTNGIHGAVAQLIDVEKKYTTAVEIALGGVLQNIITNNRNDAKNAINYLKKNNIGRATFLPIDSIEGRKLSNSDLNRIKQFKGVISIASDLVECDQNYRNIIESFLGKTIVVDNIDNAINISKTLNNRYRLVTLEGDLFNIGGSITGGSYKNNSNLLLRSTQIEEHEKRIKSNNIKIDKIKEKINFINDELETINKEVKENDKKLNDTRIEFVRIQGELKKNEDDFKRIESHVSMLQSEKKQIKEEIEKKKKEAERYKIEKEKLEEKINNLKKEIENKTKSQKNVQTKKDNLHQDITDYKISVNSIKESIKNNKESIENTKEEKKKIISEIERRKDYIEKGNEVINKNKDKISNFENNIKQLTQNILGKESFIERKNSKKENLEESIKETKLRLEEINNELEDLVDRKNRIDIRVINYNNEIDNIKGRLWEDYELTYNNCLSIANEIDGIRETEAKIDEIKNKMKELGEVNVNAIEEFKKTKERHIFLTEQLEDMEEAREKLKKVIHDMEIIMKKRFLEQFYKINKIFNEVFQDLFLGGKASLALVDEQNVLESGIEINVQPPGKKLQNMMLLSGGEKAFTAISLLFAIIKLKDTPFCMLDEIDAALDDSNVDRFSEYLADLSKRTQFILVTHRKGTMENSNILYGVTVEEKGVSKIVSLKMDEK